MGEEGKKDLLEWWIGVDFGKSILICLLRMIHIAIEGVKRGEESKGKI